MKTDSTKKEVLRKPSQISAEDFKWDSILYYYTIYICIIFLGGITNTQTTIYGASLFLLLFSVRYWRYLLRTRLTLLTYCIFLCLVIPLIPMMSYDSKTMTSSVQELIKYIALHIVILFGISLPLPPLNCSKKAWILYTTILMFLVIGCFWSINHGYKDPRMKGFLPNPNTFAFTAMMLFFLTNSESSRSSVVRASHFVVITLLFLSRTSGALIGSFVGFIHLNLYTQKGTLINRSIILSVSISLVIVLFIVLPNGRLEVIDTTKEKITVVEKNYSSVLSGKEINFYSIVERQGVDNTSGIWRLYQWHRILTFFFHSSLDKIMFGYGIGTTDILFKQKPHNDYIRILFETGIIGLILNLIIWGVLYSRMAIKDRWIVIAIAVFCFTENNYDHFPAMSLLALYMISAGKPKLVDTAKQKTYEKNLPQVIRDASTSVACFHQSHNHKKIFHESSIS